MQNPITSQKSPFKVKVKEGTAYFWCACGESQRQPLCDGSHSRGGSFKPVKYLAKSDKVVFFCGCKITKHPPFCDNSHIKL